MPMPEVSGVLADEVVNPSAVIRAVMSHVFNGTTWDRLRGNATDGTLVNLGSNNDVTIAGAVTVTPSGVQEVEGDEAEGSGSLPQPLLIGGDDGTDIKNINVDATTGDVQVDVTNTVTVDGSGVTQPVSGTVTAIQSTATNLKVDASGVAVPVTDNAGSLTVDNATISVVGSGMEATAQRVTIATDSTGVLSVDDNGGALTVDGTVVVSSLSGTVAVTQSGTWDEVGINDSGNAITIDWAGTAPPIGAGTEATALRVTVATDSTGVLSVDDNGGALTVDGSVTANAGTNLNTSALALEAGGNLAGAATSLAIVDDWDNAASDGVSVSGDVAHDSPDAGEPAKIGGIARQTNPTAVADADRTNAIFDDLGRQVVILNQVRDLVTQNTGSVGDTTETTILSAGAVGVFHDLVALDFTNASATAVRVDVRDATAGSVVMSFNLAANGGVAKVYATPWKQTTAANNWTMQLSAGSITVHWNIQAVKNI